MDYNNQLNKICNDLAKIITVAPESDKQYLTTSEFLLNIVKKTKTETISQNYQNIPEIVLKDIIKDIDLMLSKYGIDKEFMNQLRKDGGCISGSLILSSIMNVLHGHQFVINDIDIYIPVNSKTPKFFSFYKIDYIVKLISSLHLKKITESNYNLIDGLQYCTMFESPAELKYNIIYVFE